MSNKNEGRHLMQIISQRMLKIQILLKILIHLYLLLDFIDNYCIHIL